jgi:hypothetical protein
MTFSEEQVEWIVAEVMRRLGVAGGARGSSRPGGEDLVLAERVVTMRVVEGRLTNVSRVVIGPQAVVTPAVRDELRAKNVELVVESD